MKINCSTAAAGLFAALCASGCAHSAPAVSGYHLIKTVPLAGDTGWDYLNADSAARRLYLSRGSHVMVLDADSYAVVGDIPDTNGVHGIALAPEFNRGFTSNGRADTVTIFDLKTLKTLGSAPTGKGPDGITYDPASKRVFAFNGHGESTTAIDASSGNVAGTIDLGGKPESAVADGSGHVFVDLENKSEVLKINSQKLTIEARWPTLPGEDPAGLAIDRAHHRLFVGCGSQKMIVLSSDNGSLKAAPAIGEGVDYDVFDPGTGLAFSSNGSGTFSVVREESPESFRVVQNVPTRRGAHTMLLDTKTHRVALLAAQYEPAAPPAPGAKRTRPKLIPGSVVLLVYGLGKN